MKPPNILMGIDKSTGKITYKIADFGTCRVNQQRQSVSMQMLKQQNQMKDFVSGTLPYMAPEIRKIHDNK